MIAPIYAPTSYARVPTEREEADEAARKYSNKEEVRDHFRAGAEWHIKRGESSPSGLEFFVFIFSFLVIVFWLISFLVGVGDAGFGEREYRYSNPASYIFWPYGVGRYSGDWLFHKN